MDGINVTNMLMNTKETRKELPKWEVFVDNVLLTNDFIENMWYIVILLKTY